MVHYILFIECGMVLKWKSESSGCFRLILFNTLPLIRVKWCTVRTVRELQFSLTSIAIGLRGFYVADIFFSIFSKQIFLFHEHSIFMILPCRVRAIAMSTFRSGVTAWSHLPPTSRRAKTWQVSLDEKTCSKFLFRTILCFYISILLLDLSMKVGST